MRLGIALSLLACISVPPRALAQVPDVAPDITEVVSGGWWESGESRGEYRLVIQRNGWEHLWSVHSLQWIESPNERGSPIVRASVPLTKVDSPYWISSPTLTFRDGSPVFVLRQQNNSFLEAKRVVEVYPDSIGQYRFTVVSESVLPDE